MKYHNQCWNVALTTNSGCKIKKVNNKLNNVLIKKSCRRVFTWWSFDMKIFYRNLLFQVKSTVKICQYKVPDMHEI